MTFDGGGDARRVLRQRLGCAEQFGVFAQRDALGGHGLDGSLVFFLLGRLFRLVATEGTKAEQAGEKEQTNGETQTVSLHGCGSSMMTSEPRAMVCLLSFTWRPAEERASRATATPGTDRRRRRPGRPAPDLTRTGHRGRRCASESSDCEWR